MNYNFKFKLKIPHERCFFFVLSCQVGDVVRNPANNETDEFYFEAYRFASQDSGQVYFHITAQVCVKYHKYL